MLDEALLDDPEALARADTRGVLRGLAAAGARIRTAARLADEAGLAVLKPDGRPRTVLVAGDDPAAGQAGELLAALAGASCPILPVRATAGPGDSLHWTLPGWAGPIDLLLLGSARATSPDAPAGARGGSKTGDDAGLVALVEQAYQRGCSVVSVAPPGSALAEGTRQARGLGLPYAPPGAVWEQAPPEHGDAGPVSPGPAATEGLGGQARPPADEDAAGAGAGSAGAGRARTGGAETGGAEFGAGRTGGGGAGDDVEDVGALWAYLVPFLALANRIGIVHAPPSAVQAAADRLDEMAARCGPATATYLNPAKTLAAELAESLPLLWSEGPGPDAVARRFAASLAARAGRPALPAALPDALTAHRGLLAGSFSNGDDTDDFFRDRLEEPQALKLRVVLLREHGPETAASEATPAHRLAHEHNTPVSEVRASATSSLEDAVQILALTDFASAYLALADGP